MTHPPTMAVTLPRVPYRVEINPDDQGSLHAALRTEWLLTNGLGGYAMGSALGVNTRRYHGLLVAATKPPVGRMVVVHSLIEQLMLMRADGSEAVLELSTQQFVGPDGQPMLHPDGWACLRQFECDGQRATWTWNAGETAIRRTVEVTPLAHRTQITYRVETTATAWKLRVRPLLALRDFHTLGRSSRIDSDSSIASRLDISCTNGHKLHDAQTWNNCAYVSDRERGQDWVENDLWSPCVIEYLDTDGVSPSLTFALNAGDERPQRRSVASRTTHADTPRMGGHAWVQRLSDAANQFVVQRWMHDRVATSVIAGYPWFGDWGRDTMIALPGLMLVTGRLDEARSTLECFARHLRNGLIPNLFDDYGGAAHYNTVDASLWFVHAVHAYMRAHARGSDELKSVSQQHPQLLRACREIMAAYRSGTDYDIFMDADGLISAGNQTTQLTWMDAARDGVVFTPRYGKAVEINALWHNALVCLSEMSDDTEERNDLLMLARTVAASFRSAFWWDQRQCLHDCLVPEGDGARDHRRSTADGRLRPNQIFAASLPFSPLNAVQRRAVVKVVGDRLLTPYGLRTLDRDDPNYRPRYEGNLFERDAAYHNGTVWPWLLGAYCEALLRVENFSEESKSRVQSLLQPLIDEMTNAAGGRCLGQIAEVYDGDAPHRPSGCPAQAWSVAETLRVLTMVTA